MAQVSPTQPALALSPPPAMLPRLDSLDLLRGIAILGIFLMNTQSMSMPQLAYVNPAAYSPDYIPYEGFPPAGEHLQMLQGANYWAYVVVHILADMKFITIFSILFGAGIVLQAQRAAQRGLNPWAVHYARMTVLLLIGLGHAYGFWYGDILVPYAVTGMILAPLRKLPAWTLALAGLILIAAVSLISLANTQHWPVPILPTLWNWSNALYHGGTEVELEAYRGGWLQQMHHRTWEAFRGQTADFLTWTFLRCGGCMLLGMALQKTRFFHGQWRRPLYATLALLLVPLGWFLTQRGVAYNDANGWYDQWGVFDALWGLGVEFNYWGSLLTAVGYMAAGVLLAAAAQPRPRLSRLLHPLRCIGRTALSNYLLQTVIGTTLFYGHGLGWFGSVTRIQLIEIVVVVWIFQLVLSTLWMKRFAQGPFEWLWHRAVYGLILPAQPPLPGPSPTP